MSVLSVFSPEVRDWFERSFAGPTPAQTLGWPKIATGSHTLIQAPTGSGKTLAAFLWALDQAVPGEGLQVLYVSPLKALNYDVERNLRAPLAGIGRDLRIAVRTGDTPQRERARMPHTARDPDHNARVAVLDADLAGARHHAQHAFSDPRRDPLARGDANAAPTWRSRWSGSALPVGDHVQRVALSATQKPLEEIGNFVAGGRPIELVDAGVTRDLDLQVVVPLEDMREPGAEADPLDAEASSSIWPSTRR